jgi:hypothetical protein
MHELNGNAPVVSPWSRATAIMAAAMIVALHGWHTLAQFGATPAGAWAALVDEQPVCVGSHALHQYHAWLAGRGLRAGEVVVYDPAFGAGYPRTPWFDMHVRPMELAYAMAGASEFHPAPYKVALGCVWLIIPLVIALAGRQAGMGLPQQCVLLGLVCLLAWSDWGQDRLGDGDVAFPLAVAALLVGLASWTRFQRRPNLWTWLVWVVWSGAAMVVHPLTIVLAFPAWLAGYARAGWRRSLAVQTADVAGLVAALGIGWPWWHGLGSTWWLLATDPMPAVASSPIWIRILEAGQFGWSWPRLLVGVLAALGLAGLIVARKGPRAGLAYAVAGAMVAAMLAGVVEPAADWPVASPSERWWFAVLVLATFPAAEVICRGWGHARLAKAWTLALVAGAILVGLANSGVGGAGVLHGTTHADHLTLGLNQEARELCHWLATQTTPAGRILIEDSPATMTWTPLLPWLTQRSYIGGLANEPPLEHLQMRLHHGWLGPREFSDWTPPELGRLAERLNLRWLVVRQETAARMRTWPNAKMAATVGPWTIFELSRSMGYFLRGRGRVVHADDRGVILADLEPEDGAVLVAFHFHAGAKTSSDRVAVEAFRDSDDPVPLLRLRLAKPIARLAVTWGQD